MLTIDPGEVIELPLLFRVDGFETAPDDGVVSWKLYRGGVQVASGTTTAGSTSLTIPGTHHGLTDQSSQMMMVRCSFKVGGQPRQATLTYRIVEPLPIYVGSEEVRQVLGVTPDELPDHHIDIYQGYLQVQRDLEQEPFGLGVDLEIVNRMVCLAECRRQMVGLQNKMLAVYATDDQRQERLKKLDLEDLHERLSAEYYQLLANSGVDFYSDSLVLAVPRSDPFLGE
ncbi:hypothetical protein PU634_10335 [Oceanimonas pelagia]|uniref:Uncharacterized protein n=1 Tax=Oceanimonas pelagia TaxID=3028314 RepID=A0AA50KLY0_9GAMM|nr:hypothetical protein [Oceanimonas pelagia]WMC09513.1 hypothetical protein PU634_10335 [Oceanimonas pelagia]